MIGVFSTWLPLAAAAAYIVTFYITPYNEIYYADSDDSDVPFTLAIVECSWSAATFIFGMLLSVVTSTKRVYLIAAVFFGLGVLLQGTAGIMRGTNLGVFGDDESTCLDASLSGCPTSRYEAVNDEIQFTAPSGGDCQFWFWGPDMRARYTGADACGGYGQSDGVCGALIENYMDWSRASSYGWRDDPADIAAASEGHIATIDKIHNMKYLFSQQATIGNVSIPPAYAYSVQPSIAGCWYWGCSPVCQPHRYQVNRWWLVSSAALFVVYVICMILSLVAWRRPSEPVSAKAVALPDVEANVAFQVPEMGRRKRRAIQNPSGLLF